MGGLGNILSGAFGSAFNYFKPKPPPPPPPAQPKYKFGIDISHWNYNPTINWDRVAQNVPKIDFVYIKSSTGVSSLDKRVHLSATEARKRNIPIGYYHYCSLNDENELKDATEEANWFIKVVSLLPSYTMPLALDFEHAPLASLDPNELLAWIKTFFSVLESRGHKDYVLYSYMPFLNAHLPKNHGLGNIRLWIAQYRNTLTLPNGWTKYWMWQYSDSGMVSGITGNVDLNRFNNG